MSRKLRRGAIAAVAALALVASACGTKDDKDEGTAPAKTEQRVEVVRLAGGNLGYPSPFAYNKGPGLAMVDLSFDTLLWKDASGRMIPWLATEWERSADGTSWTFTIRDGVKWNDGTPLTADDVAFTYGYVTTGPGKTALGVIRQVPVTEAVVQSPSVVVLKTEKPFAPFEDAVAGRVPIVPKHIWEPVTDPGKFRDPSALVGSGPYRVASFDESAGTYQYVADDNFWGGPPHVKRLEFVPTGNELLSIRRGELDVVWGATSGSEAVPEEALKPLRDNDKYGFITAPGESNTALHFNLTQGFPFDDKRFRQSIAYALDRQDMVKRLLLGRGEVGSAGDLAPSHPLVAPGLPAYAHDVARAEALLDEIGIRDADGNGVRELPDGSTFKPQLLVSSTSTKPAELMKEYLREAGIDLEIVAVDQAAHDAASAGASYQMALVGYGGLGGDPDWLRQRISNKVQSKSFLRIHGYNNPQFEEAAGKQLVTMDPTERAKSVQSMQKALAEDLPVLSLYLQQRTAIFDKTVFDGWYYTPGGVFGLYPHPLNKHAVTSGRPTGV